MLSTNTALCTGPPKKARTPTCSHHVQRSAVVAVHRGMLCEPSTSLGRDRATFTQDEPDLSSDFLKVMTTTMTQVLIKVQNYRRQYRQYDLDRRCRQAMTDRHEQHGLRISNRISASKYVMIVSKKLGDARPVSCFKAHVCANSG